MQLSVPLAHQHGAGSQLGPALVEVCRQFLNLGREACTVEQTTGVRVEVAQMIGLKPVRQNAKQEMAREVRWRPPPEHCVPSGSELCDIETTQSRDLDVEHLPIQRRRTNRHARHGAQAARRRDRWEAERAPPSLMIR